MKLFKLILTTSLLFAGASLVLGQDTLYAEYFSGGVPALTWFDPWTEGGTIAVQYMEGNPSGDNYVGKVSNETSGGGVGTALSGTINMTDYEVQAQVYCTVSGIAGGAYHGILARWDTTGYNSYYSFRSDFDTNRRLQLRKFPGQSGYGDSLAEWSSSQIPGGMPTQDSWHLMAMKLEGDQIWAYWDGVELSGCPITDSELSRGFFGIYVFKMPGNSQTYCDDIIVLGDAAPQPFDFIAQENLILDEYFQPMSLRPAEGQTIYFQLNWDAINGISTSPPFGIELEMDQSQVFLENNPGVEPNTSHETQSNAWVATLGVHTLLWTLDTNNSVPESNENNNTLPDTFLVLPVGAFDFQADSSWLADSDTIPYPASPTVGNSIRFVLHWSVPMGTGTSDAFNIRMKLDGENYYMTTMPGAQFNHQYMTVTNPWVATEGFHYYEWLLDSDNWVNEFNEGNNWIMEGFEVNPEVSVPWDTQNVNAQPKEFRFCGVYPNPFNPSVTLRYENVSPGILKIKIYDIEGRQAAVLVDSFHPQGVWEVTWNADNIAGGVYFAVLEANGQRLVQPLFLVK
ncbi:MAG: CARDB domain-containing protein [bacterium]